MTQPITTIDDETTQWILDEVPLSVGDTVEISAEDPRNDDTGFINLLVRINGEARFTALAFADQAEFELDRPAIAQYFEDRLSALNVIKPKF